MLKPFFKKIIPLRLRRILRKIQREIRHCLRHLSYQIWIFKYDRKPCIDVALNPAFTAFIEDGSILSKGAFHVINVFLKAHPHLDLVYTDSDHINSLGFRVDPYFKTEWDPYRILTQNYVGPLWVVRNTLLENISLQNPQTNWELFVALSKCTSHIGHIPHILCHRRQQYLSSQSFSFTLPKKLPLVSIIIPTKDAIYLLKLCIESLFKTIGDKNFEILVINNKSEESDSFAYFKEIASPQVRILDYPHSFNYAAINNFGAQAAQGEILLLLNNDTEAVHKGWLDEMLKLILIENVGIVGAKLYYPDDTIQHAGMVLGMGGVAQHVLTGLKKTASGYFDNLQEVRCVSAVTAACLMIKKSLFFEVNGLDETHFPVTFNDTDLCLKVRQLGYYVLWTPHAELYHKESATRGEDDISPEKRKRVLAGENYFKQKWGEPFLQHDPFYNPNLTLKSNDYALSFPHENRYND